MPTPENTSPPYDLEVEFLRGRLTSMIGEGNPSRSDVVAVVDSAITLLSTGQEINPDTISKIIALQEQHSVYPLMGTNQNKTTQS